MRRTFQLFSLSFIDILISALGAVLFLFIVVDKGTPAFLEPSGRGPLVYLNADTTNGVLFGLQKYLDTLELQPGAELMVRVNSVRPDWKTSSVSLPKPPPCDCDRGVICPDPDHHRYPKCKNPSAHFPDPIEESISTIVTCSKTHCEDKSCEKDTVYDTRYLRDPVEIPYRIAFAINDFEVDSKRDVDLKVCLSEKSCVHSKHKDDGFLRWIDLNDTGIFRKGVVTGGEIIISQRMKPGTYKIWARYESQKRQDDPPSLKAKLTVATKTGNKIRSFDREAELFIDQEWSNIGLIHIDANGNISQTYKN